VPCISNPAASHRSCRTAAESWRAEKNAMKAPLITLCLSFTAFSEVKTEVAPLRPFAKTVAVEKAKIHLAALDGDLEGNAVVPAQARSPFGSGPSLSRTTTRISAQAQPASEWRERQSRRLSQWFLMGETVFLLSWSASVTASSPLWSSTRGPCGGQTSRRLGTRMNSSGANSGARA
jgi:hypothetical protein